MGYKLWQQPLATMLLKGHDHYLLLIEAMNEEAFTAHCARLLPSYLDNSPARKSSFYQNRMNPHYLWEHGDEIHDVVFCPKNFLN